MSNKKFSQLPVANAFGNGDFLHILQGGLNKRIEKEDFTDGFVAASNNLSEVNPAAARANLDVFSAAQTSSAIAAAVADLLSDVEFLEFLLGTRLVIYPESEGQSFGVSGATSDRIVVLSFQDFPPGAALLSYVVPLPQSMAGKKIVVIMNNYVSNDIGYWIADPTGTNDPAEYIFKITGNSSVWRGIRTGGSEAPYTNPAAQPGAGLDAYINVRKAVVLESDGDFWTLVNFV